MSYKKITTGTKVKSPYMYELMQELSHYVQFDEYAKGTRFCYTKNKEPFFYFIRSGMISINIQPDDILLGIFTGPTIRGLLKSDDDITEHLNIKVLSTAHIAIVREDSFYKLLNENELWEVYARYLQFTLVSSYKHFVKILPTSSYEVICSQLYELMSEPPQVRSSMTAEMYIRSKTMLSRSNILKILSELRVGGYIEIQRGFLKSIDFLPKYF